jgi:nucleotide sugar dehydrogenase
VQIAVIGLGKIGLPLAAQFAEAGHNVVGVDINTDAVEAVNAGREPFPGEACLQNHLSRLVPAGRIRATTDYGDAVPQADAIVVVVPLFVDAEGRPDFDSLDAATSDIAKHLTADTLVSYETTLPVGTTRTRWKPALEQYSGLVEGKDFHVVFSPERVLTGRVFTDLRKYPKLIGALTEAGGVKARKFYEAVLEFDDRPDLKRGNGVWDLGTAEAAEMAKLAETTYRDVNIGLANQFAVFAQRSGVDVFDVIEAANSQPYSHIHSPGIAVGGHCIPVYPRLYLYSDPDATVVRAARDHNAAMPHYAVDLLDAAMAGLKGRRVLVLGATYRTGVKETAFSGVFPVVDELRRRGATVSVADPMYSKDELAALGLPSREAGAPVDALIVQTDHDEYRGLAPSDFPGLRAVIDGRHLLDPEKWKVVKFVQLGAPRP